MTRIRLSPYEYDVVHALSGRDMTARELSDSWRLREHNFTTQHTAILLRGLSKRGWVIRRQAGDRFVYSLSVSGWDALNW